MIPTAERKPREAWVSTANPCHQCRPLGAMVAFQGVEGCVPFLHGSQGCATYMRRYLISHFREPVDIASSSVSEKEAVLGGGPSLRKGLRNVTEKYAAGVVGVATTCLTETTGEDLGLLLHEWDREVAQNPLRVDAPEVVTVPCPSYDGSHVDGFHGATLALVRHFAKPVESHAGMAVFPNFVSPADLRHLREATEAFGLGATFVPDYADRLDGPALSETTPLPEGGTSMEAMARLGGCRLSVEFGRTIPADLSASRWLARERGVPSRTLGLPIGIRETDAFFALLEELSGRETPVVWQAERGRLLDACVDAHKYLAGRKAVVYGDEDLVAGIVSFLAEIGVKTVLVATGGKSGRFAAAIDQVVRDFQEIPPRILEDSDFRDVEESQETAAADLLVGHSKGYKLSRTLGIPLVRVGFPVHDRFGAQRLLHLGYRGALGLLDSIVNAVLEQKQDGSSVGYGYL